MDLLALPLSAAKAALDIRGVPYEIVVTRPARSSFPLSGEQFYVVRQLVGDDGSYRLVVAAKMVKEA